MLSGSHTEGVSRREANNRFSNERREFIIIILLYQLHLITVSSSGLLLRTEYSLRVS